MTAPAAVVVATLGLALGGCATARPADRVAAVPDCAAVRTVEPEAPLPERPNRWWWGAADPGRVALRSSYGLDGCPLVLQ